MKPGLFERNADTYFLTLDDGRTIFFPSGVFGRRGYVMDSPAREHQLRVTVRRYCAGVLFGCLAMSILFGIALIWLYPTSGLTVNQLTGLTVIALALVGLMSWLATLAFFRMHTRRLQQVSIRNNFAEHYRRMGAAMNPRFVRFAKYYLIFFALACLVVGLVWFNLFALLLAVCMAPSTVLYWLMDRGSTHPAESDSHNAA
jgi:uncharacterized membrane protein YuzA (DUF378 family)